MQSQLRLNCEQPRGNLIEQRAMKQMPPDGIGFIYSATPSAQRQSNLTSVIQNNGQLPLSLHLSQEPRARRDNLQGPNLI